MSPEKFLGMEERKKGSNPTSPGIDPSRFTARGRKGIALDLSVLSTMLSHILSGIAFKAEVLWIPALEVNAVADPARRVVAMIDFIVFVLG
jgi:hypothetical protein